MPDRILPPEPMWRPKDPYFKREHDYTRMRRLFTRVVGQPYGSFRLKASSSEVLPGGSIRVREVLQDGTAIVELGQSFEYRTHYDGGDCVDE